MRCLIAAFLFIASSLTAAETIIAPNAAALQGITPAPGGQLAIVSNGGIAFGFGYNGSNSFLADGFTIVNPQIYGQRLYFQEGHFSIKVMSPEVRTDYLNAKRAWFSGPGQFVVTGAAYVDNVIDVHNKTGGYSSIAGWHPAEAIQWGRAWAVGIGPAHAGEYADRVYFASNPHPANPWSAPPDIHITQEQAHGQHYYNHHRVIFNGALKATIFYGWTNDRSLGPVALKINPDATLEGPTITELQQAILALDARLRALESGQ